MYGRSAQPEFMLWLTSRRGVDNILARDLVEKVGTAETIYRMNDRQLREALEFSQIELSDATLASFRLKSLEKQFAVLRACRKEYISIITIEDRDFPRRLREIEDPPVLLFVKGTLPQVDGRTFIGVVGTRQCTQYGLSNTERICFEIAQNGGGIVTGLAAGIDTAAAIGALRGYGPVIGAVGAGLDIIYPRDNAPLFDEVADRGAIISEYLPGTTPTRYTFPRRNRLISALSLGVLVVEAPIHSGALITVEHAVSQCRDVFAVPGNIDSEASGGSTFLLKRGAPIVTCGSDLTDRYATMLFDPPPINLEPISHDAVKFLTDQLEANRRLGQRPGGPTLSEDFTLIRSPDYKSIYQIETERGLGHPPIIPVPTQPDQPWLQMSWQHPSRPWRPETAERPGHELTDRVRPQRQVRHAQPVERPVRPETPSKPQPPVTVRPLEPEDTAPEIPVEPEDTDVRRPEKSTRQKRQKQGKNKAGTKKTIDNSDGTGYIGLCEIDRDTLNQDQRRVLEALDGPTHIDVIAQRSGLPVHVCTSTLTMMEIRGAVKHISGDRYVPNFRFKT